MPLSLVPRTPSFCETDGRRKRSIGTQKAGLRRGKTARLMKRLFQFSDERLRTRFSSHVREKQIFLNDREIFLRDQALRLSRLERGEEKWEPVFRPPPALHYRIDHVHDFGLIQSKIIVIYTKGCHQRHFSPKLPFDSEPRHH
jgi:hypothetical protein